MNSALSHSLSAGTMITIDLYSIQITNDFSYIRKNIWLFTLLLWLYHLLNC